VNPDIVADVLSLPLEDSTVDEIVASHILEHTPFYSDALGEWKRVLKPGGRVVVVTPDILQAYAFYRAGQWPLEYFMATIFGGYLIGVGEEKYQSHFQAFTTDMLKERMAYHFENVKVIFKHELLPLGLGEAVVQGTKPLIKEEENG